MCCVLYMPLGKNNERRIRLNQDRNMAAWFINIVLVEIDGTEGMPFDG